MKVLNLIAAILLVGCSTTPKNLYVHPEKYNCDLIIPTIWDGNHPVKHFEHELLLNTTYYDYRGIKYTLVETKVPNVYALRVQVVNP